MFDRLNSLFSSGRHEAARTAAAAAFMVPGQIGLVGFGLYSSYASARVCWELSKGNLPTTVLLHSLAVLTLGPSLSSGVAGLTVLNYGCADLAFGGDLNETALFGGVCAGVGSHGLLSYKKIISRGVCSGRHMLPIVAASSGIAALVAGGLCLLPPLAKSNNS